MTAPLFEVRTTISPATGMGLIMTAVMIGSVSRMACIIERLFPFSPPAGIFHPRRARKAGRTAQKLPLQCVRIASRSIGAVSRGGIPVF